MSGHILSGGLTALCWLLPLLAASGQIIVGKRWPPPRWFIASAPSGFTNVIADGIDVVADGNQVIAPP